MIVVCAEVLLYDVTQKTFSYPRRSVSHVGDEDDELLPLFNKVKDAVSDIADNISNYIGMYEVAPDHPYLVKNPRSPLEWELLCETITMKDISRMLTVYSTLKLSEIGHKYPLVALATTRPLRAAHVQKKTPKSMREALAARLRAYGSKYARSAELYQRENQDDILDYRGESPPPISIYHPAFTKFLDRLNKDNDAAPDELVFAADLVARGRMYGSEDHQELPQILEVALSGAKACTNPFTIPTGFSPIPTIIRARSDDSYLDPVSLAECEYIDAFTSHEAFQVRQACCCPALLITIDGARIQVAGAAFGDHIIVQPLADVSLLPLPTIDGTTPMTHAVIYRVARLLRALRAARIELDKYYSDIASAISAWHRPPPELIGPHWTEFVHPEHGRVTLTYTGRIGAYDFPHKAVFTAQATAAGMPAASVVVKFPLQYGKSGHEALAPEFAPRLWHCAREPSVGGLWAVVMDFVQGSAVAEREVLTPAQGEALGSAVGRLHARGLVFGDLREVNVLTVGDGVRLIDFDWCGTVGEARYPPAINMEHKWPMGVRCGQFIEQSHDRFWVKKMSGMWTGDVV